MYIPKSKIDQQDMVNDLVRRCMQTQQERTQHLDLWRKFYLSGSDRTLAVYNKVLAHVDTVSSFIFAPGGLRLYIDMPSLAGPDAEKMAAMGDRMSRELNNQWHGDGHDLLTSNIVTWSLVYGTMFEKTLWTHKIGGEGIVSYALAPHNLGVLREDIDDMNQQEVICHEYYYSADELWRKLKLLPNGRSMWDEISFLPSAEAIPTTSTLQTIITQAQGPVMSGVVSWPASIPNALFRPVVVQDIARAHEVWVWDDMEDDYHVFTQLDPAVLMMSRGNPYLPRGKHTEASHPFTKYTPWPIEGSFWGLSEVYPIMMLQDWNERRISDFRTLQDLQIKPPLGLTGFMGITDEKMSALWQPGGYLEGEPNAKIDKLAPEMPKTILEEFQAIDGWFMDMSGMRSILRGEGVQGIRDTGHAALASKFAGARINKKTLAIEQGLIDSANIKFRLLRRYDDTHMQTDTGITFVADQLDSRAMVRVDAHSQSPIFAGDQMQEAGAALKVGAIDQEDFLEFTHLPGKTRLLQKIRKRQEAKKAQLQQLMQDPKVAEAIKKKQAAQAAQ